MISILYGPVVGANVQFYGRGYKNRDPWLREMEHQRATSRRRTPPQKVILIPSSTCRGTAWVNTPDPGRMRVVVRLKAVVPFASPGRPFRMPPSLMPGESKLA